MPAYLMKYILFGSPRVVIGGTEVIRLFNFDK
jgi:hypothetical protein